MRSFDQKLSSWADARETQMLAAIQKHGVLTHAAKSMGMHHTTFIRAMERLEKRAAMAGYSPSHDMVHTVPDGYVVKGVSTYYDKEGNAKGQWVKSSLDADRKEQIMREALSVLSERFNGLSPNVTPPTKSLSDIMVVYPFGDPHVGLQTWSLECGENFNLKIGRQITLGAVDQLISIAPAAETAVLLLLGDVYHTNDQTNQTVSHKHQLDVDSRFVKILQVGIETYRHAILRALEKHNKVIVKTIAGNHDPQAVWSLAFTLAAYFSGDDRVEVDLCPSKFWYYRFGKVLIGSTHGDTVKHEQLGPIMASDRSVDWGETTMRYWLTGHVHHSSVKEFPGVVCESFRTLAAQDAYASGHGYRAGRDMRAIVYHKDHGEIARYRCDISMLDYDK